MEEMLHRPPALLASKYPDSTQPLSRYLVAAPRCYAFLTHFPFFALHMKVGARKPSAVWQFRPAAPISPPGRRHMLRTLFQRRLHFLPPPSPGASTPPLRQMPLPRTPF